MKKYTILTIAALAGLLASCTNFNEMTEPSEVQKVLRITGAIVGEPATKTYMGDMANNGTSDYYPVYWSDGDNIAVFSKNSVGTFTLDQVNPSDDDPDLGRTYATFIGDAGDMPIKFEGSNLYPAAYPVDNAFAQISSDGNLFVGSYLPNIQKYKYGTFEDNVYPMASASTNGETFPFYNLCGIVQLRLWGQLDENGKHQVVQSIYLTGNNNEVVAGGIGMKFDRFTGEPITDGLADKDNGKLVDTYGSEGYTRVILDFSTSTYDPDGTPNSGDEILGLVLSADQNNPTVINIAVIPQTFTDGITVEMRDGRNMGQSFKTIDGAQVTIKRSKVTRMVPFEYEQPEPLQTANSYVYDHAGYYIMPAYAMGNRMDVKLPTEGRRLAADLLWSEVINDDVTDNTTDRQDLKPAVTNIEYLDFADGNGMLQFKVNIDPDTGEPYRGNAAIALYDVDTKEVIWSWHVWMTDTVHDVVTGGTCSAGTYSYDLPDGTHVDYAAEASSGELIVMDRNLGAISANPADGWKTYGLYYQNGRRDPFIGGHWDGDPNIGTQTEFKNPNDNLKVRLDESAPFNVDQDNDLARETAPVWYNESLAPKGWNWLGRYQNISTALRFPMTFSAGYNDNNGQWTDYEDSDNKSWMDPNVGGGKKGASGGTHGSTGLSDGGHQAYWNRTKTIMDPCPVGYSVLGEEGGLYIGGDTKTYIFEAAGGTAAGITHPDHGVYGIMTQKSGYDPVWWPAAGVRTISGYLGGVGYQGMYFYYDHIAATHGGHGMAFNNGGGWKDGMMTNQAASVRCVREKQFSNLTKYPLK